MTYAKRRKTNAATLIPIAVAVETIASSFALSSSVAEKRERERGRGRAGGASGGEWQTKREGERRVGERANQDAQPLLKGGQRKKMDAAVKKEGRSCTTTAPGEAALH